MIVKLLLLPFRIILSLVLLPFKFAFSVFGTMFKLLFGTALLMVLAVLALAFQGYLPGIESTGIEAVYEILSLVFQSN